MHHLGLLSQKRFKIDQQLLSQLYERITEHIKKLRQVLSHGSVWPGDVLCCMWDLPVWSSSVQWREPCRRTLPLTEPPWLVPPWYRLGPYRTGRMWSATILMGNNLFQGQRLAFTKMCINKSCYITDEITQKVFKYLLFKAVLKCSFVSYCRAYYQWMTSRF